MAYSYITFAAFSFAFQLIVSHGNTALNWSGVSIFKSSIALLALKEQQALSMIFTQYYKKNIPKVKPFVV